MTEKNKRIVWIDYARSIAIILVVICHAVESEYYGIRFGFTQCTLESWLFQNTIFTIGRLGVPLFLMITGTLLLGREYDVKSFYKRSLLPLLITTEIWILINYLIYCWAGKIKFSIISLLYEMLFIRPLEMSHMWYMPMILGLYIVIPFLSKILTSFEIKDLLLPMILAFLVSFGIPLLNTYAGEMFSSIPDANPVINTAFLGGAYGLYLTMGYFIGNTPQLFSKIKTWILLTVAISTFIINSLLMYYLFSNHRFHSDTVVWYTSPLIFITAVSLFEVIKRIKFQKLGKQITVISAISFSVFLLHNIVLHFFNGFMQATPFFMQQNIIIKTVMRFCISYGVSVLISLIIYALPVKRLKKYVFFIK